MNAEHSSDDLGAMLQYYRTYGPVTDPAEYAHLYEALSSDVAQLVRVVQGVLIHDAHASRYGFQPSKERLKEVNTHSVEQMLERIVELDDRPLAHARRPDRRLLGCCRQFADLLCSMLEHAGVPARVRVGFAKYFEPAESERLQSHYICEYWHSPEQRWIQVDPQIDNIQRTGLEVKFDTLDLPAGEFLTGGQAWKLCRAAKKRPEQFGVWLGDWSCGWPKLKGHLLHDWMALNKMPLNPWHGNEYMHKGDPAEWADTDWTFLDKVAKLTTADNETFAQMRSLYGSDPRLTMPANWKP